MIILANLMLVISTTNEMNDVTLGQRIQRSYSEAFVFWISFVTHIANFRKLFNNEWNLISYESNLFPS